MRRILLGACVVAFALAAFFAFRYAGDKAALNALDQALAALPPGYTATHGETEVDALTSGVVVHDVALSHDGTRLWSASRITVAGADQRALRDVFDPAAYPGGHPAWTDRRKLLSHVEAEGLVFNEDTQPRIERLTLDGLSGRPFLMPPTPENRSRPEFRADAALALAVASATLRKLTGGDPATHGHLEIGAINLEDYDAGKLGHAEIKDLAYERSGTAGTRKAVGSTIARLAAGQIDVRQWLMLVQQGRGDQQAGLAAMRAGSANIEAARIVQPGGPLVALDSLRIASTYRADGTTSGTVAIRALTIARNQAPANGDFQILEQVLGSDRLVMDVDSACSGDQRRERVVCDRDDLDLHDLGTLKLSGSMSDLPARIAADAHAPATLSAVLQTKIERARIAWEDRGLANRLLAFAAQRAHSTPEALRATLAVPLIASLALLLPDQPDAADQVGAFLRDPKTLVVTLAPPAPVSLAEVAQAPAAQRAHLLGMSVKGD